jgi:hypothetical protein
MNNTINRLTKENLILRKRHDVLAIERDRAHDGYITLRKQTERLQNAARTAARKAQLAALNVQHSMISNRVVNGNGSGSGSSSSSVSGNDISISEMRSRMNYKTTSKMGEEAFHAAEDLCWVALGGETDNVIQTPKRIDGDSGTNSLNSSNDKVVYDEHEKKGKEK